MKKKNSENKSTQEKNKNTNTNTNKKDFENAKSFSLIKAPGMGKCG